jgi:hypothetical protein
VLAEAAIPNELGILLFTAGVKLTHGHAASDPQACAPDVCRTESGSQNLCRSVSINSHITLHPFPSRSHQENTLNAPCSRYPGYPEISRIGLRYSGISEIFGNVRAFRNI